MGLFHSFNLIVHLQLFQFSVGQFYCLNLPTNLFIFRLIIFPITPPNGLIREFIVVVFVLLCLFELKFIGPRFITFIFNIASELVLNFDYLN